MDCKNISHERALALLRMFSTHEACTLKRIYGNFEENCDMPWVYNASPLNLQVVHTPRKSHLYMAVDAIDLLNSGNYDGFIIVSSSFNYTLLAEHIRRCGKSVAALHLTNTYSSPSRDSHPCIDDICMKSGNAHRLSKNEHFGGNVLWAQTVLTKLKDALAGKKGDWSLEGTQGDWVHLSAVGQRIPKVDHDFHVEDYGPPSGKLFDLIRMIPEVECKFVDSHYLVRFKGLIQRT